MAIAMIVDDEPLAVEFARHALRPLGLTCLPAFSARAACDMLLRQPVALALLDLDLPDASGHDLCRWLREARANLAIVFLSGYADLAERRRAFAQGADDYLCKPVPAAELTHHARVALTRHRPAATPVAPPVESGALLLPDGRRVALTPTERRIFAVLLARQGTLIAPQEIADEVFGPGRDPRIARQALEGHLRRLRLKIEPDPLRPRWLIAVRGVGIGLAAPTARSA